MLLSCPGSVCIRSKIRRDYINSALLTAGHNPDELWGIPWGTMKEKNTEVQSSTKPEVSATPPPKPIPPIPPK